MTLPYERTRAVLMTEEFLRDLMDAKKTPRVPKDIRRMAYTCLRHYPTKFEMEMVSEINEDNPLKYKVFGKCDY